MDGVWRSAGWVAIWSTWAGWNDAYCAKLEAPHRNYGKRIASLFTHALFDWLTALGLTLVLMGHRAGRGSGDLKHGAGARPGQPRRPRQVRRQAAGGGGHGDADAAADAYLIPQLSPCVTRPPIRCGDMTMIKPV